MSDWIEITIGGLPEAVDGLEEQAPTLSETVLCYWEEAGDYEIAYYDHEEKEWRDARGKWIDYDPSHWQFIAPPQAAPPKEEE